jgi:lysophospholipase L1-like esterase
MLKEWAIGIGSSGGWSPSNSDISLRYTSRSGSDLLETGSGSNRDAKIMTYISKFDGTNYLKKASAGIIANLTDWTLSFKIRVTNFAAERAIYSEIGGTAYHLIYFTDANTLRIMRVGDGVGLKLIEYSFAFQINTTYYITIRQTTSTTIDCWINGSKQATKTLVTVGASTITNIYFGTYDQSNFNLTGNLIKADVFNTALSDTDAVKFHSNVDFTTGLILRLYPTGLTSTELDVAGSNGVLTWGGTHPYINDLSIEGSLDYLDNGYSVYWKQGSSNIVVPYTVTSALATVLLGLGYLPLRKHLGSTTELNMAPCIIDFDYTDSTNASLASFDRSNTTIHNSIARFGSDYDSGNPYRWRIEDIADFDFYDGWKNATYKLNYARVSNIYDLKYLPVSLKEIIVFNTQPTVSKAKLNQYFNFGIDNASLVQWNSILAIPTSGTAISAPTTPGLFTLHAYINDQRIFQSKGYIKKVALNIKTLTNITSVKLYAWYRIANGGTYNQIMAMEVLPLLAVGDNEITLPIPILVEEGDYLGFNYVASSATDIVYGYNAANGLFSSTLEPAKSSYEWSSQTQSAYCPLVHTKGIKPKIIGIGDSIMESAVITSSLIREQTFLRYSSWLAKMAALDSRITYQNKGYSGDYISTLISDRFARDVVAMHPDIAIINGGINDVAPGMRTKAQFLSAWTTILDLCVANDIVPVAWLMLPNESLLTAAMRDYDDWNTSLSTLVATYPRAILLDMNPTLSVFRVGGDAGNLWDWNPTYRRDGLHPNAVGDTKIAELNYLAIQHLL